MGLERLADVFCSDKNQRNASARFLADMKWRGIIPTFPMNESFKVVAESTTSTQAPERSPGKKSIFDQVERHYNSDGLLTNYREHILPELKENPEKDISQEDGDVIDSYLGRHSGEYRKELAQLLDGAPPLASSVRQIFMMAAYKEGRNIFNTLSKYAELPHQESFEVVIFENHPQGVERDTTREEIERFKKAFPGIQVVHLYKEFDGKGIGRVRKYLADSVLERKREAGRNDSMLLISHDADLEGLSSGYLDAVRDQFDKNPSLDAAAGPINLPEEAFVQFPLIHASVRLLNFFHVALRYSSSGAPRLQGPNAVIRSGAYALIGGYNAEAKMAEDLELGWLIEHGRGRSKGRLGFVNKAKVTTSPRREIHGLISKHKKSVIGRYNDGSFDTNEEVRDRPLEDLMREGRDFSVEEFHEEVQATYSHFLSRAQTKGGWLSMEDFQKSFARAMLLLGVTYHIEADKVVLDDISKLTHGLAEYREKRQRAA